MKPRTWWPSDWADEVMPPGRATPDDFLIDADGHFYIGYRLDAQDVREQEKRHFSRSVDVGDIVKFIYCDGLGEAEVQINLDGTSSIVAGAVDPRATNFCEPGNADTLADSMEEFVRGIHECCKDTSAEFPMCVTVRMAFWSDEIPYKLVPMLGGETGITARLEQVSAAQAQQ